MSAGEQRRLALARAVLAKRSLLWLDEPDAGLDIERIDNLGFALRKEAENGDGLAIVVVTHNTRLVCTAKAERVLALGYNAKLFEIEANGGPDALDERLKNYFTETRASIKGDEKAYLKGRDRLSDTGFMINLARWLTQIPDAMRGFPAMMVERSGRRTLRHTLVLTTIRGVLYYPFIGAIFGGVLTLVFIYAVPVWAPERIIALFGAEIVVRFTPPIAGILIAACAGSTIAAWVGQMTAQRQLDALTVLGVDVSQRILAPIWWGLSFGAVINTITFAAGIVAVMGVYVAAQGGNVSTYFEGFGFGGNESDTRAVVSAVVKTLGYAALLSAVSIGSASTAFRSQRAVAAAITRGIVWSSLVIMSAELMALAVSY